MTAAKPAILVIDAPTGMAAWRRLLRGIEAEIISATAAAKALAAAREQVFSLIIADLRLADARGPEFVAQLREEEGTRDAPILFITTTRLRKPSLPDGFDEALVDCIARPIDEAALSSRLRLLLELHKGRQKLKSLQGDLAERNAQLEAESIQRRKAEDMIHHHAGHDELTQLHNRLHYMDRLALAVQRGAIDGRMFALAYLDLDDFKHVNDRHGHQAGDELLRQIASRLRGICRKSDTVARLGGDEFGMVFEEINSVNEVLPLMEKLRKEIARPYSLSFPGHKGAIKLSVGASVGASIFPTHALDVEHLIRAADMAMYQVKATGKNHCLLCADPSAPPAKAGPAS